MGQVINAFEARLITSKAIESRQITHIMEWLSGQIKIAGEKGEYEFTTDVNTWHTKTEAKGCFVKDELSRLGYTFDDYYKPIDGFNHHGKLTDAKMIRISWQQPKDKQD